MEPIFRPLQITQDLIDRYGRLNGDRECIHYDAEQARRLGFRGTIAHGTLLMAPLFDLAILRWGPAFLSSGSLSIKWTAPVCAGDLQLASIDDEGCIEAVIDNLPGQSLSIRAKAVLRPSVER